MLYVEVTSPEQIFQIMQKGFEHRAVGCHDINAHSSRSHCLLIIHVAATHAATGVRTFGKLTLCDLAGSERITKTGATGLTLTEAQNINKSLLELGNVISALMQQSKHVPYRYIGHTAARVHLSAAVAHRVCMLPQGWLP